ncbi:hypothetical protein B0H11DRAFT_2205737 [Mycena galericulata]|nr:hypothetical protein B0H11DRAFT_2205737 [Mycena galericulata]
MSNSGHRWLPLSSGGHRWPPVNFPVPGILLHRAFFRFNAHHRNRGSLLECLDGAHSNSTPNASARIVRIGPRKEIALAPPRMSSFSARTTLVLARPRIPIHLLLYSQPRVATRHIRAPRRTGDISSLRSRAATSPSRTSILDPILPDFVRQRHLRDLHDQSAQLYLTRTLCGRDIESGIASRHRVTNLPSRGSSLPSNFLEHGMNSACGQTYYSFDGTIPQSAGSSWTQIPESLRAELSGVPCAKSAGYFHSDWYYIPRACGNGTDRKLGNHAKSGLSTYTLNQTVAIASH